MKHITIGLFAALLLLSCKQKQQNNAVTVSQSFEKLNVVNTDKEIACKLTTPELQARKAGAVAELKKKILETVETEHGYAFRFAGSDETLGQLMVFIQAERQCCGFSPSNSASKTRKALFGWKYRGYRAPRNLSKTNWN